MNHPARREVHDVMKTAPITRMRSWCLVLAAALLVPTGTAWGQFSGGGPSSNAGSAAAAMPAKKKKAYKKPEISRMNSGTSTFTIAAVVDDKVILLEDIMSQLRPKLEAQRKQMPPEQYKQFEQQIIQMAVKGKIQQTIMLNELKKKIPKPEIMDKIRGAASLDFEKHMQQLAKQSNLKSTDELMEQLKKEGADVTALKNAFIDQALAQQYMGSQIMPKLRDPTRDEMEDFYRENIDKWAQKAGVVWRNIEIKKGADPAAAHAKISDLRQQLDKGADFAELAKSSSEGTMAVNGGLWSKTSKGSYQDEAVDEALFTLPVGELSPVIEGKSSFHLIRVEERNDGSPTPFTKVQEEIKLALRNKQIDKHRRQIMEEIAASHHVISIFDGQNDMKHQLATPSSPAMPPPSEGQETMKRELARPDTDSKLR